MKIFIMLIMILSFSINTNALEYNNEFDLMGTTPITIDGDYSDWVGLPISYEYNWDNSSNCWYWGCWVDEDKDGQGDVNYMTPEGTYDNNVRHLMQLYCDGEYVYLHIKIATIYESGFNGEDYQFYIDGNMAAYQVVQEDNTLLTNVINNMQPGTLEVKVKHRDSSWSYTDVPNSKAYVTKYENNKNSELELKIPLSEMVKQNPNINIETMSVIEFFTPNLMYRRIASAGTSTYPIVLMGICISIVSIGLFKYKRGKKYDL